MRIRFYGDIHLDKWRKRIRQAYPWATKTKNPDKRRRTMFSFNLNNVLSVYLIYTVKGRSQYKKQPSPVRARDRL